MRHSRGGCLPMEPVFPTVTIEQPDEGSLSLSPPPLERVGGEMRPPSTSPFYDRSRPISEIVIRSPTTSGINEDEPDWPGFGRMSSFKPAPPPPKPTREEIDRDVQIILKNMGLDNPLPPPMQQLNGHVVTVVERAIVEPERRDSQTDTSNRGPVLHTGL